MPRRTTPDDVTIPDPGDLLFPQIPVEAIMAYSVGRAPLADGFRRLPVAKDDGPSGVAVKVDGVWQPL